MPKLRVQDIWMLDRKKPGSTKDVVFEWLEWLSGETIASAQLTFDTGITVTEIAVTGTQHRIRVAGGDTGEEYRIESEITTTAGEVETMVAVQRVLPV